MSQMKPKAVYAFIKPAHDAHTIGIQSASSLLRDCGYLVITADDKIEKALSHFADESARHDIISWLRANGVNRLGLTYRLDKEDALKIFGYLLEEL